MYSVVTVIFYDTVDGMTNIEHYVVKSVRDLKKQVGQHQLCDNAAVKWYDRKTQLAFAISGDTNNNANQIPKATKSTERDTEEDKW